MNPRPNVRIADTYRDEKKYFDFQLLTKSEAERRYQAYCNDLKTFDDIYLKTMLKKAQELVNAYILGEVMELIGADECFVESTNKPTEQLNKFGSYIKGQNELRQELRNKANKKWGK